MNNGKYLIIFTASLYMLFFYIAFWSALPSSITGNTAALPGITSQCVQLVDCELVTGTAECLTAPKTQPQGSGEPLAGIERSSWIDVLERPIYQCALMAGASYN